MLTKTRFAFASTIASTITLAIAFTAIFSLTGCDSNVAPLALGTLERDRVSLTATANEIIREIPIQEGQIVSPGDVLVKLDSTRQHAILTRATAEAAKAKAYLLRLTNGERPEDIASAQSKQKRAAATLTEAQQSFLRTNKLAKQKLASIAEQDKARAARDVAQADYNSSTELLTKLTNGERIEDIQQAQAALAAATAEVSLQQQIINDLTVVATRNGILESLPYNLGERVPMNGIVASIQTDTLPYARVYVPEPYRVKLSAGMKLKVHVDGIDKAFEGTLRWIATEPAFTPYYALNEDDRARLVFLAEIDLPETGKNLPAGVPAQVEMPNE
jgi:HlyD family secretion protein